MSRDRSRNAVHEMTPNMTPLVDVVMVILIFLMLAGSFSKGGWFLQSTMPIKQSGGEGAKPDPSFLPPPVLEVRVDNSPDGFRVMAGDIRATGDKAQLKAALEQKRKMFEAAGNPPDKVQVTLMPARAVKYENLIAVYEAALRAGFKKVGFAVSH